MNDLRTEARKKSRAVPVPALNANKYFSYGEAWVRIRKAHGSGFYLEAVTLEESIIADRLISFLVCVGEIDAGSRVDSCSFGRLIQSWMKRMPEPVPVPYFPDLRLAVDEWRKRWNQMVHGMVKCMPGAMHSDVLDLLREAEFVAFQGQALAHAVSDWVKKAKRQFIQASRSPAWDFDVKVSAANDYPQ